MMGTPTKFREYAADCLQKATGAETPEEKTLHLNMALAWIRLADQSEAIGTLVESAREIAPSGEDAPNDPGAR